MTHKLRTATSGPVAAPPFAIALSISTSPYLRGLKAGTGGVDLSVQRYGDNKISLQILEARGDIEVTTSFSG
jgi:hypothetical protein